MTKGDSESSPALGGCYHAVTFLTILLLEENGMIRLCVVFAALSFKEVHPLVTSALQFLNNYSFWRKFEGK